MRNEISGRRLHSFRLLLCLGLSVVLVSCASVSHYEEIDKEVAAGQYAQSLTLIEESREKEYRDRDLIVYYLDAGLLAHFAGEYEKSSQYLQTAERSIEDAFTKSISLEASTFLVNDSMREYPGEDYEDIYLNAINALNYYHRGDIDGALVEVRRIDNKLRYLSVKYGDVLTKAQEDLLHTDDSIPYDENAAQVKFSNSALARYLGMLFYRADGNRDSARIDRDKIRLAFANQPDMYGFPLPQSLSGELDIPRGKARLNIISFNGPSPVKTEKVMRILVSDHNWVKIAIPEFSERPSRVARTVVSISDGESFELELIENMSTVARETFRQRSAVIYMKSILRSIAKTTSSAVLEEGARQTSDSSAALILGLLSLGTQVYAEASEQADLRMSRYFPAQALVGGITVDPGNYTVTVSWYDTGNTLIQQRVFEDIEVIAGQLNLLEAVCIQ